MVKSKLSISERFWNKVDVKSEDDCWNWTAGRRVKNWEYGGMGVGKKVKLSNRLAWELTFGEIPENMCVLHRCDNSACCNPKHLFLGDRKLNNQDRNSKNRSWHCPGEQNPSAKLTEKQVMEIRSLYKPYRFTRRMLAKKYNISVPAIAKIVDSKTWSS